MTTLRSFALRAALLIGSVVVSLLMGEAVMRVVYRDAGKRTLMGPGGRTFDHVTIGKEQLRGRREIGPRKPGIPRVMVIGDSITYGLGVHEWRDTWPERLAVALEQNGHPHEFAVFGFPGTDMPQHLSTMVQWGRRAKADILVYQWYVNDIESVSHRPSAPHWWQRRAWHEPLRASCYLYYVLDYRMTQLVPPLGRTYVQYILQEFVPGSVEWSEYEREFHEFGVRARAAAPERRLMVLYPQVPFRDRYPLQPVHDRMKTLAGPHLLSIPPVAWVRSMGSLDQDRDARWTQVQRIPPASAGYVMHTKEYFFSPGAIDVEITAARSGGDDADEAIATLELLDAASDRVIASAPVRLAATASGYVKVPVRVSLEGDSPREAQWRLRSEGHGGWTLAEFAFAVDYGFEVVDLTNALNTFDTHASVFDAHPNEAAQRVVADHVYQALVGRAAR